MLLLPLMRGLIFSICFLFVVGAVTFFLNREDWLPLSTTPLVKASLFSRCALSVIGIIIDTNNNNNVILFIISIEFLVE